MDSIEITIRSIQHYLYCPHRWGLMQIERDWAENIYVTKANIVHNRVHNPLQSYTSRNAKVFTSVPVYNDLEEYNLYGIVDCLELKKDNKNGVVIGNDKYNICIVEYKPTKPRDKEYHEEDLMQVFAQKICVDFIFGCDCQGVLYYADVKKRISLPLRENYEKYDLLLKESLTEMRKNLAMGIIPPIQKNQKCSGCSMKDLCMPSSSKRHQSFLSEINKIKTKEDY